MTTLYAILAVVIYLVLCVALGAAIIGILCWTHKREATLRDPSDSNQEPL